MKTEKDNIKFFQFYSMNKINTQIHIIILIFNIHF